MKPAYSATARHTALKGCSENERKTLWRRFFGARVPSLMLPALSGYSYILPSKHLVRADQLPRQVATGPDEVFFVASAPPSMFGSVLRPSCKPFTMKVVCIDFISIITSAQNYTIFATFQENGLGANTKRARPFSPILSTATP